MKRKFSKILGRSLALALVLSLVVMAAPVAATVGQPEVTFATDGAAPDLPDATYTIEFVSGAALTDTEDTITIEFHSDTTIGTIAGTVEDQAIATSSVAGQRVRITVPASADIIAGETVDVFLDACITNPPDGDYELTVYTSQEPTAVTSETYMISGEVALVTATPDPTTVGVEATYTIGFTTSVALRGDEIAGDDIVIEFPEGTDISAVVAGDVTGVTVLSATPVGQVLTITLGGDLAADAQTVTIANITNPTTVASDWTLTVYTIYSTGTSGERIPVESDPAYITEKGTTISQVAWSEVDDYIANNTGSTAFQIQTQTEYGNSAPVETTGDPVTFTLTATSGAFYGEDTCDTVITTIEIDDGASESGDFWYKGATDTLGEVDITADEEPSEEWDMASTTILVNPMLELWGGGVLVGEYNTFEDAMAVALPDDIIKVAPSTYDGFYVDTPDLTIESTDGEATTFIEGTTTLQVGADNFVLGGAEGKGFTLQGSQYLIHIHGDATNCATDVIISYNTLDNTGIDAGMGIKITDGAISGLKVMENTFIIADQWDIGVHSDVSSSVSGLTVTDNVFTGADKTDESSAVEICSLDISDDAVDTLINGNTFTAIGFAVAIGSDRAGGGLITDTDAGNLEISDNHFDAGVYGVLLINANAAGGANEQNVVITRNNFTGNTYGIALDYGLYLAADDYLDTGDFKIGYNDFSGNTYAVFNNADAGDVDASNNYWGDATGAYHATSNPGGLGDEVSDIVTYAPWLNASGGTQVKTDSILVYVGWNLISLPLIPSDPSIETVLDESGVTVIKASYYTGGPAGEWLNYIPSELGVSDLTEMTDGKGYWIDVSVTSTTTFTANGVELAPPGQAPPTYELVAGWNLIGFTSINEYPHEAYLGSSVMATKQALYRYDTDGLTGAYQGVPSGETLLVFSGYWIAVSEDCTIFP